MTQPYDIKPVNRTFGGAALPKKPVTLADLWPKTVAIKVEKGDFITLRVHSTDMPVSLLEGDGWLASVRRQDKEHWEVVIWGNRLDLLYGTEKDTDVKRCIGEIADLKKGMTLSRWLAFSVGSDEKTHAGPRLSSLG